MANAQKQLSTEDLNKLSEEQYLALMKKDIKLLRIQRDFHVLLAETEEAKFKYLQFKTQLAMMNGPAKTENEDVQQKSESNQESAVV